MKNNLFDNPIEQSIYELIHENGGSEKLSSYVLVKAGTLNSKASPRMTEHNLTVEEMVALTLATKDYRLLHTICTSLGFAAVSIGHLEGVSDAELMTTFTKAMKEVGDISSELHKALDDGKINRAEANAVRKETTEAMAALAEIPRRLDSICDDRLN